MHKHLLCAFALAGLACTGLAQAQSLTIVNHSFEDTDGQSTFNEFTFGQWEGWQFYNATGNETGFFPGTLSSSEGGDAYFTDPFPDGDRVAILFLYYDSRMNLTGPYGLQQTLSDTLQADTVYRLQVEVGNITSGTSVSGDFFPLLGFPGYQTQLMVYDESIINPEDRFILLGMDDDSLSGTPELEEGEWATSSFTYDSALNPEYVGLPLAIRLINLNVATPDNDIEVDFDNVRLTIVPEPTGAALLLGAAGLLTLRRRC